MKTTNNDLLAAALDRARARRRLPAPDERRRRRERAGLSQSDLAGALGVDRAAVSRWESGEREPCTALLPSYLALLDQLAQDVARG